MRHWAPVVGVSRKWKWRFHAYINTALCSMELRGAHFMLVSAPLKFYLVYLSFF
jgi:hypothetical protein